MGRFFRKIMYFLIFFVGLPHCSDEFIGHSELNAKKEIVAEEIQTTGTYYIEFLGGKVCLTDPYSYRDNMSGGYNTWGSDMLHLTCPYPNSSLPSFNREYQIDIGRDKHRLIQSLTNLWCAGVTDGIGRVVHWNCSRVDDTDLWDIIPVDGSHFKIRSVAEGKCMYPYEGEKVRVGNCDRPDTVVSLRRGRLTVPRP